MWMMAENGGNAERLLPGLDTLCCELAFYLGDQRGGTPAPSGFGEAFPARERREGQSFESREVQSVKGLSPTVGCVLLRAIKPIACDCLAFGKGSGNMDSWPIAWPLYQSFFRAMAQDISQSPDLRCLLGAHQDRLIASGPDLLAPIRETADFSRQVGVDVAHELGGLYGPFAMISERGGRSRTARAPASTSFRAPSISALSDLTAASEGSETAHSTSCRDEILGKTGPERKFWNLGRRVFPMGLKESTNFDYGLKSYGPPLRCIHEFHPHRPDLFMASVE